MATTAENAQAIVDGLSALIRAKIEGTADISELFDKSLGQIGVSSATSLSTLTDLLVKWQSIAAQNTFTETSMEAM